MCTFILVHSNGTDFSQQGPMRTNDLISASFHPPPSNMVLYEPLWTLMNLATLYSWFFSPNHVQLGPLRTSVSLTRLYPYYFPCQPDATRSNKDKQGPLWAFQVIYICHLHCNLVQWGPIRTCVNFKRSSHVSFPSQPDPINSNKDLYEPFKVILFVLCVQTLSNELQYGPVWTWKGHFMCPFHPNSVQ